MIIIKKLTLYIGLLGIVVFFCSCATFFGKSAHPVSFTSEPLGTNVYIDYMLVGKTPLTTHLKANKDYTIEFKKEGSSTITRELNSQINVGWVFLNSAVPLSMLGSGIALISGGIESRSSTKTGIGLGLVYVGIFGFLGYFIDIATGKWYNLDADKIHITF